MKDGPGGGEVCHLFHENIVFMLGQGLDLRSEMFDSGSAGDKLVIALPPLGSLHIANAVLKLLLPVLELLQLLLIALLLSVELFKIGVRLIHKGDLLVNRKRPLCQKWQNGL